MKKFNWPLSISSFGTWDKLKIGAFLFWEPMWTYGRWVRRYEEMWEQRFGVKHAIMVSSGSAANELIALRRKWELEQAGEWPRRNKIVFPVNTWLSSCSVWINLGFEPVFTDVSKGNLNMLPDQLIDVLVNDESKEIATVFYTALLGWANAPTWCKEITEKHGARFLMDNCEASFSSSDEHPSILTIATCSTSVFFSHFTSTGTEGGLIFTESQEEAEWYQMARSHGLTRGMPAKYKNPAVNPDFDFYLMGSNYRSSNLQAYMAIQDLDRAWAFSRVARRRLFNEFNDLLDIRKYWRFQPADDAIPLAIPILCETRDQRIKVEATLKAIGVLTRPIIGGCLVAHRPFQKYGKIDDFPVAKWSHECGLYIGLNPKVTLKMVRDLAAILNAI